MVSAHDNEAFAQMANRLNRLSMANTPQTSHVTSNLFQTPRSQQVIMKDPRTVPHQQQPSVTIKNLAQSSQFPQPGHSFSPAITERDPNAGPSLYGTPEAIALARELQSSFGKSSAPRSFPSRAAPTPANRSSPIPRDSPVPTRLTTSQRENQSSIWAGKALMTSDTFDAVHPPVAAKRTVADSSGYTFKPASETEVKRPASFASTNATVESKVSVTDSAKAKPSPDQDGYTFKPAVQVKAQTAQFEVDRDGYTFKPALEAKSHKVNSASQFDPTQSAFVAGTQKEDPKPIQQTAIPSSSSAFEDARQSATNMGRPDPMARMPVALAQTASTIVQRQKEDINKTIASAASASPPAKLPPHLRANRPIKTEGADTHINAAVEAPKKVKVEGFTPSEVGASWKGRGGDPTLAPGEPSDTFNWGLKDHKQVTNLQDAHSDDHKPKAAEENSPDNGLANRHSATVGKLTTVQNEHKVKTEPTVHAGKNEKHEMITVNNDNATEDTFSESHMLQNLLASFNKREANIKNLNRENLELKLMVKGNNDEAAELKSTIQLLEKGAAELKDVNSKAQKENASLEVQIAELGGKVTKLAELEAIVKRLETDNADLKASLSNKDSESTNLKEQIETLEEQAAEWTKSIENLMKKEERRKFLGTTGSQVPFNIVVSHPKGLVEVQVNSAMKISELIRRIRADTSIAPGMSANPVIVINKEQAGHMTTLGEHGVQSGSKPSIVFSYDPPSSAVKKSS